jgi:hypothetical protein
VGYVPELAVLGYIPLGGYDPELAVLGYTPLGGYDPATGLIEAPARSSASESISGASADLWV